MKRFFKHFLYTALLSGAFAVSSTGFAQVPTSAPPAKPGDKVLKYAFVVAESGFDPAQISDLYSRIITANIFEAPLTYDYLTYNRLKPQTAAAMPEIAPDFKTFTYKIRPGIYFADDAAFNGQKRELTAQDYVYSIKRHYDPKWKSPSVYLLENAKILGMSELRAAALKNNTPFPYDTEVEGLKALDRYTLQFKFGEPQPRFAYLLADGAVFGAVAREVVEKYGDKIMEHPVGTGPYKLTAWRRSSKMVLEKNPNFRDEFYNEQPPDNDARSQAIAARLKGKKLPIIDRIEISIIEESQPRWLAFMNGETDLVSIPGEFINIAIPGNKLAPNLAKLGVEMDRTPNPDFVVSYFGMENPIVGGYTPDKVALRRAIALAVDDDERKRQIYRNQVILGQGPIPHGTFAYDPEFRSTMSEYNPARAKALLDMFGYTDKNGDGWRDLPDGKPLVLEYASQPDSTSRQSAELWKKHMDAINVKIEFKVAKWPEQLKQSRAGKLMMWGVGWSGGTPDSDTFLAFNYGPNKGQANHSRFDLPEFNKLYEQQRVMADSPERADIIRKASKLVIAYMPIKVHAHRFTTDLNQPWVVGYRRHLYMRDFWKYIDIDESKRQK
jgi:ABC-type transport system substrate-binding protein